MCGRYTLATPSEELLETFDVPALTFGYFARYNVAPGQRAPVVAVDDRGRRAGLLTWGFAPSWMDEPGAGFINARAESVTTKSSFREAYRRRRCLVPADGFYEWKDKAPFRLRPTQGRVLALAGIWETWRRPGADVRHTFAILTTDANDDVLPIHTRMPVLVERRDHGLWLDRSSDPERVSRLLRPALPGTLIAEPVSTRVNRVTEDDPGLIEPV